MDKKRKKILFIIPNLGGGGSERVLVTLLANIDRVKFEPILLVVKKEGRYKDDIPKDIEVIDLNASQLRYAIFKIVKSIKSIKPDIVYSTLGHLNLVIAMIRPFFSKQIAFVARESNTVSSHNQQERYPKLFDWLFRKVYNNLDLIINQSKYMKNDLIKNYYIDENKIKVIYNPVDFKKIEESIDADNKILFDKDKINLLCVGKLAYEKGYDILIEAVAKLDDNFFITILGEGGEEESLKKLAKERGVSQKINFIGFVQNPYSYMSQADMLLLPSRYEGLPNVILEAQACGKPAITFDAPGGMREIIEDGFNGFLVTPFNTDEFAQKIQKASNHDFNSIDIKEDCRKKYSVKKIIREYEDILEKVN